MNKDLLKYATKSLSGRKTRSFLTILSIVIGIMSIFALISFGQGLSNYVENVSKEMGTDKLLVQIKTIAGQIPEDGIGKNDLDFIKKIKGVDEAAGFMIGSVKIQPSDNINPRYTNLAGFPTDKQENRLIQELMTVDIDEGRDLRKGDKNKVVLGNLYKQDKKIFDKKIVLGQKILVNDVKMEVVGFYEELGNPQDDQQIYMTFDGYKELMGIETEEYQMIVIRSGQNEDPEQLSEKIQGKLRRFRNQDKGKEDFSVDTFAALIAQFGTILTILNTVLVMIALISVVISAINIMNTMYTSVLERTKDIGIMKAIGAKNSDIIVIFLVESGILGFIGGAIGIILGYLVASTGGNIAAANGYALLKPIFPTALIVGCLLFAVIVGALSGLAPAIQGSKQKPVDSLRYE